MCGDELGYLIVSFFIRSHLFGTLIRIDRLYEKEGLGSWTNARSVPADKYTLIVRNIILVHVRINILDTALPRQIKPQFATWGSRASGQGANYLLFLLLLHVAIESSR